MKIKDSRTYHSTSRLKELFGFSQWWYYKRKVLLVEVITDDGLSGWGECYGPAKVNKAVVEDFFNQS